MKFYVVTWHSRDEGVNKAIICERRAIEWVMTDLESKGFYATSVMPAECHWTAQIVHPREGGDLETGWEA